MAVLRLGTRRSPLATTQSSWVAEQLREHGHEVALVEITTEGDRSRQPLTEIGGTGVFAAALRQALLAGEVDLAVHSLKDLPTAPVAGLAVAAVPVREDPRDVLVARDGLTLGALPPGARIGTGSPRRAAQLVALGLGLEPVAIRGNVETRLGYVARGELDAVVLARAGLIRLDLAERATEVLDPIVMLPAPGQGALALECRTDRPEVVAALAMLDDPDTRARVTAERSLLAALEAGCTAPVGALAEVVDGIDAAGEERLELYLRAFLGLADGSVELRRSLVGAYDDPVGTGERLARLLLDELSHDEVAQLDGSRHAGGPPPGPPPTDKEAL